jgi:hypothetical protein
LALYQVKRKKERKNKTTVYLILVAIELVIRETAGEKALKQLFLKEQEEKIKKEISRSNPKIAEAFKQGRETGLNALNEFIMNLESSD